MTTKCPISKDSEAYYKTTPGYGIFYSKTHHPIMRLYNFYLTNLLITGASSALLNKPQLQTPLEGPSTRKLPSLDWQTRPGATDDAILLRIPTTGCAGYQIYTEEDPKAHDSPIQGRISHDHTKTPTRA